MVYWHVMTRIVGRTVIPKVIDQFQLIGSSSSSSLWTVVRLLIKQVRCAVTVFSSATSMSLTIRLVVHDVQVRIHR